MKKLKLMTILGTRPEIIRLSEIIKSCDKYFCHILVHTGQNWDDTLSKVFFDELGLRQPDFFLDCVGGNLGETMGNIISKSYDVMDSERPDAVLILGDTNSALSAISAKRLKIPIFHMEAGNRCWDWNVSEMINRKIVDHISDINLPYTENSRRYLLNEGIDGKTIFVTGSPMRQVLNRHTDSINNSLVLEQLGLEKGEYFIVSAHREENIDNENNFLSLMESVNAVAEQYRLPVIYSTHPRSRKIIEKRNFRFHPLVKSLKPFGFFDYNNLQTNSKCVLSDSGTLSEESAMLGFRGVLIRTSTERPEASEQGSVIIGGIKKNDVLKAVELSLLLDSGADTIPEYNVPNVSEKIVKIIQSYTHIVNKTTWLK